MDSNEYKDSTTIVSFYSSSNSSVPDRWVQQFLLPSDGTGNSHNNIVAFLALAQKLKIDIRSMRWQPASRSLGGGGQGIVSHAALRQEYGFAFKRVRLLGMDEKFARHSIYKALIAEISVLGHPAVSSHPNVVDLEGICWEVNSDYASPEIWPVLVFEKAKHGDLGAYISSAGKSLTSRQRLNLFFDIIRTVDFMHTAQIIHGDIKPGNILIFEDNGKVIPKLADFGHSAVGIGKPRHLPISIPWYAPEIKTLEDDKPQLFDFNQAKKADIFSLTLMALWLLYDIQVATLDSTSDAVQDYGSDSTETMSIWKTRIEELKATGTLLSLAEEVLSTDNQINADEKGCLLRFFTLGLTSDPESRASHCSYLIQTLGSVFWQSDSITFSLEGLSIYSEKCDAYCNELDIAPLISSLRVGDYRVRRHVVKQLEEDCANCQKCATNAAFQLAICSNLGFGTRINPQKTENYLKKSGKSLVDLESTVDMIVRETVDIYCNPKMVEYEELGMLPEVDIALDYRRAGEIHYVIEQLKQEITDLETSLGPAHTVVFSLSSALSELYRRQGQFGHAIPILERLIRDLELDPKYGRSHRVTFQVKSDLASLYQDMDDINKALSVQEDVVRDVKLNLGKTHPFTQSTLQRLSGIYCDAGRYDEAHSIMQGVLETQRQLFGPGSQVLANSLMQLGEIFSGQSRLADAEMMQHQAIDILKTTLGESHADTLLAMENLSITYRNVGRLKDAEINQDKVIDAYTPNIEKLGDSTPDFVRAILVRAGIYREQERFDEAECAVVQAAKSARNLYGHDNPSYMHALETHTSILVAKSQWKAALKIQSRLVRKSERVLGPSHSDTITRKMSMGATYSLLERLPRAQTTLLSALKDSEGVLKCTDHDRYVCLFNIGEVYRKQSRFSDASNYFAKALQISTVVYGKEHVDTVQDMAYLASAYYESGFYKKALDLRIEILRIEEQKPHVQQDVLDTIEAISNLASTYYELDDFKKAEILYRRVYKLRLERGGKKDKLTLNALGNVAAAIAKAAEMAGNSWGLDEALKIDEDVLELSMEVLGLEHEDTITCMENLSATYAALGRDDDSNELESAVSRILGWKSGKHLSSSKAKDTDLDGRSKHRASNKRFKRRICVPRYRLKK